MKIYSCPVCGHSPIITTTEVGGYSSYVIKCSNLQCPMSREVSMFQATDMHESIEDAYSRLSEIWNDETIKINELILHRDNI